jgi:galactonate dehydratase
MKNPSRRGMLAAPVAAASAAQSEQLRERIRASAPVSPRDKIKITRLETFLVKPRWLFLKIHTDAGIVGLGEPYLEGRARTCAEGVKEVEPYLIGKDPRHVVHHWHAIYSQTCYHGGLILSSVLSGIDQALWDIKGKALGVPVYELLGGPTRRRVRIYRGVGDAAQIRTGIAAGFTAFKTGPGFTRLGKFIETRANVRRAAERFAELRSVAGDDIDLAVDFHGNISPATSKILIHALEPYQPAWIEDPVQCENVDVLAEVAHSTFLPVCVGERLTTKWTLRQVLEKGAARILNPDMSHAGGITEVRLIAGLAETYYATIAPHCPLGPIALASAIQLAGAIPNFLMTEHVTLGEGYLKTPFVVKNGYVELPIAPGLGIELDENALADKIGHDWRNPETYDADDGSVVDW